MKKMEFILVIIIIIAFVILFVFKKNNEELIEVNNTNIIGNDTNNIIQGIDATIQDDWIYYSNEEGLYRVNIDGTNKKCLKKGIFTIINVADKWIYYVKLKHKNVSSGIVTYSTLYRMTINGTNEETIAENVSNVNVRDNNIYYIKAIEITGVVEQKEVHNFDLNKNGALAKNSLDGKNEEILIENAVDCMVINDNYIYYKKENKLYVYNLKDKSSEYLFDFGSFQYIISNNDVIFYDRDSNKIKIYYFESKQTRVLIQNVENINMLQVNGNILYYTDNNTRLFSYNMDTEEVFEIKKNFGFTYLLKGKIFIETGYGSNIKELKI